MAINNRISALVLDAQHRMFRLSERDHGLTLKAIGIDANIPYNTVRSYADANGTTIMPVDALVKLVGTIPDYLISQMFDCVNRALMPIADGTDYDSLARDCIDFAAAHAEARHPSSPGGVEIVDVECISLDAKASKVQVKGAR